MTVAGPVGLSERVLVEEHGPYAACEISATLCNPVVKLKKRVSPTLNVCREAHVVYVASPLGGIVHPKASPTTCLLSW